MRKLVAKLWIVFACACPWLSAAENAVLPGRLALERPTLICLGVHWRVSGDENRNAKVSFEYRKAKDGRWKRGLDLFRVEPAAVNRAAKRHGSDSLPQGTSLFAGSLFDLEPDTVYSLRLRLSDPDGGDTQEILRARTRAEPKTFANGRRLHVVPGSGGGSGTAKSPFRGLDAADGAARPGDVILVHKGVYKGTWKVRKSGEPGKPIVWRGGVDGEAIIDGQGDGDKWPGRAISAGDLHDVHFEKLTIRNARYLVVFHSSLRMVMRRCNLYGCAYGFVATNNDRAISVDFYLADNTIKGPSAWPRTKGIESARGIQISGLGHVVCHNRIMGFADAIDTFPSRECSSIDFYCNEISEMTDDGIEMDYSQRNTRCFRNRITNVFQGITTQPIYGGPVYIFRNALYNVGLEVFKMHNSPSGALLFHNTAVKHGMPLILYSGKATVSNFIMRNNLFIGGTGNYAYENTAPMRRCDFDYDGFGGGPYKQFLKWNRKRYDTVQDVHRSAPVYKHAVVVDASTCFASKLRAPADVKKQFAVTVNDLRLDERSGAIDKGVPLPGINDGFFGKAPDLGAYEFGTPFPAYGPRPENRHPATGKPTTGRYDR